MMDLKKLEELMVRYELCKKMADQKFKDYQCWRKDADEWGALIHNIIQEEIENVGT